ncbi:hypothetical protein [Gimesia panareensis]|uniref:Uncharacterized protein n=1 Tax=Gimesia panareensis TaxID=2527978 RepID=A0A518FV39_9PLAN|nr:hypothetical protein [Gimesia panareensis]QDT29383.1 hypothetical protein Enr10x_47360 [Gimesia panareensis]QDU52424.1 hypothetical protein Pan110_48020 [Gimesia panareensis]QDV20202.1 hypothetical protein Pan153_48750 [Gimesia panareensis]
MRPQEELTGANKKHGYVFGCDGVIDFEKASDRLGFANDPLSVTQKRIGSVMASIQTGKTSSAFGHSISTCQIWKNKRPFRIVQNALYRGGEAG